MKVAKSMLLIGLGVGGTLAYQKYSKPAMQKMEKMVDKKLKKVDQLEEMM